MKRQIICINWGTKYGAPYVNRLYAMVARNITPPFTLTCFTDSAEGMRPEIRREPLPDLPVALPTGTKGIWPKARLWSAELADLTGPVLFMDLDLVITGNLDGFFEHGDPDAVVMARNQTTPFEKLGQTSLFRFPVGKLLPLKERFMADPQGVADEFRFEQRFVTREAPGGVSFWPARLGPPFPPGLRPAVPAQLRDAAPPARRRQGGDLPRRSASRPTPSRAAGADTTPPARRPITFAACSAPTVRTRRCAICATICRRWTGCATRGARSASEAAGTGGLRASAGGRSARSRG